MRNTGVCATFRAGPERIGIGSHGSEFVHRKRFSVLAGSLLCEKRWSPAGNPYYYRNNDDYRRRKEQTGKRQTKINNPFKSPIKQKQSLFGMITFSQIPYLYKFTALYADCQGIET